MAVPRRAQGDTYGRLGPYARRAPRPAVHAGQPLRANRMHGGRDQHSGFAWRPGATPDRDRSGSALMRGVPPGLPFTLVNLYGPTECTVAVTSTPVLPGGPVPPPIGIPIDGARCYVLDGLDPVPDGEAGEMCLAGACVARGYLGDPATTSRFFVPDITVPGERMYRTGDKVRRRTDGSFEYLGRLDDQVKIRGFLVNIWMNKGKAITRLGLDSQRKSKLIDLLVDQYAAQQDTFDIVRKSGPNGPENGDDILETVSQAYEKNIADFLGQADYSRFQKAIEVGLRENAVEHWIGPQMEMVGAALAPEQLSAMADNCSGAR